jgi:hypothetical protein
MRYLWIFILCFLLVASCRPFQCDPTSPLLLITGNYKFHSYTENGINKDSTFRVFFQTYDIIHFENGREENCGNRLINGGGFSNLSPPDPKYYFDGEFGIKRKNGNSGDTISMRYVSFDTRFPSDSSLFLFKQPADNLSGDIYLRSKLIINQDTFQLEKTWQGTIFRLTLLRQ